MVGRGEGAEFWLAGAMLGCLEALSPIPAAANQAVDMAWQPAHSRPRC